MLQLLLVQQCNCKSLQGTVKSYCFSVRAETKNKSPQTLPLQSLESGISPLPPSPIHPSRLPWSELPVPRKQRSVRTDRVDRVNLILNILYSSCIERIFYFLIFISRGTVHGWQSTQRNCACGPCCISGRRYGY